MKLEFKKIAPYLPYGVKIQILNHKCDYVGIEFSEINGYYFLGDSLNVSYNGGSTGKSIEDFKPILRPLSDLTKEEYRNLFYGNPLDYKIDELPYKTFTKLLELHFDVFHLIPQGLAIDINTL